jgi:transposase
MHAIGIDMSKRSFHAACTESFVQEFKNTPEGIEAFIITLKEYDFLSTDTTLGVEATGVYHLLLCATVIKQGWHIVVINPLLSSTVLKAQSLRKVKTDRIDALGIRQAVLLGLGYAFTDTDAVLTLKALVTERQGLVALRARVKQQQEAHAAKQKAVTHLIPDHLSSVVAMLKSEIRAIEKHCLQFESDTQVLLRSIPGIGVTTAAILVAYIGDITRFTSPEKLVAYIGLDPRVHQSGTSVNGRGYISKRGNTYLRQALFNAAFIARQYNPELDAYYRKKLLEGKHYFSAMCAVERKLVHLIWAVWTRGTPYIPRA